MSYEIHFPLTHSKKLDVLSGNSNLTSIPAIFTLYHTTYWEGDREVFRTDKASLHQLARAARGASEEINDTLLVMGKMGAYSNMSELGEWEQQTFMWSVTRLCESRSLLDTAAGDFEFAVERGFCLPSNP